MKCHERFKIAQHTIRKPILNDDNMVVGEHLMFAEIQVFCECYKEECAAWDKEKNRCRKVGG